MRFCPSFHIVELMSQGKTPQQACETVVKKIIEYSGNNTEVAVIALDMKVNVCGCFVHGIGTKLLSCVYPNSELVG